MASFGFLGSHVVKVESNYDEPKHITKRFRVYRYAVIRLFGLETFSHYRDFEHSTYLMINNRNKDADLIKDKAKKMFHSVYPELEY